jgi:chorismate synthase
VARLFGAQSKAFFCHNMPMRWLTAGESHGPALSAIIEGIPASVELTSKDIDYHLARRRLGFGRGARQNFEADKISILGGIRLGLTQGGPISIQVGNSEWPKWEKVMSADPVPLDEIKDLARNAPLSRPRPGHADLVGMQKYDLDDARPILSHVVSIGQARVPEGTALPKAEDMERIDADPVRCADPATSLLMIAEIEAAHTDGDTLGGVCEVLAYNVPPGLGSHVHWDRRLDARLAGAMMGIQAIKGVEIGDGFRTATRRGSVAHDEIERGKDGLITRRTDRAGGTEGGMSNGEILRVSVAMKPISTVPKALDTIDVKTGEAAKAINQRSDVCAVPAAGVVAEAMAALVLAEAVLEKFGGDSITETRRNYESYIANLRFK